MRRLLFRIEITEMGQIARLCLLRTPYHNGHGRNKEGLNAVWRTDQEITHFSPWGKGDTTHEQRDSLGVKSQGMPGHNKFCFYPPSHFCVEIYLGWGVHVRFRRRSWDKSTSVGQSEMTKTQKTDPLQRISISQRRNSLWVHLCAFLQVLIFSISFLL